MKGGQALMHVIEMIGVRTHPTLKLDRTMQHIYIGTSCSIYSTIILRLEILLVLLKFELFNGRIFDSGLFMRVCV